MKALVLRAWRPKTGALAYIHFIDPFCSPYTSSSFSVLPSSAALRHTSGGTLMYALIEPVGNTYHLPPPPTYHVSFLPVLCLLSEPSYSGSWCFRQPRTSRNSLRPCLISPTMCSSVMRRRAAIRRETCLLRPRILRQPCAGPCRCDREATLLLQYRMMSVARDADPKTVCRHLRRVVCVSCLG